MSQVPDSSSDEEVLAKDRPSVLPTVDVPVLEVVLNVAELAAAIAWRGWDGHKLVHVAWSENYAHGQHMDAMLLAS